MFVRIIVLLVLLAVVFDQAHARGCKCYKPSAEPVETVVVSRMPHEYLRSSDLPKAWDWRNINGTNYCTRVMTQQNPSVCGSCWAEAATGALSDRYNIATNNKLKVQLGLQNLLNFKERISGGGCTGGDSLKAYKFINKYGISDDTCAPFVGVDYARGFSVSDMVSVEDVQSHQCYLCNWDGSCTFVPRESYDLYGADEYGTVTGVDQMKSEIFARGPISCSLNSESTAFDEYTGGIVTCQGLVGEGGKIVASTAGGDPACKYKGTDHVVVIAGWGVDAATGTEYWVGRNSYGTRWGEGAGGGWFRLKMHTDELNMESHACTWGTPSAADVQRALKQFESSL